jgi:hypothetical protein
MKAGDIIGLKYRMLKMLGRGGNSSVFLAENLILSNLWAIKAISKDSPYAGQEIKEVHILKNLNHPMLPRIADLVEDESNTYIVMDYIEGESLLDMLKREGRISEQRLVCMARELCGVLSYLHGQNPPIIYRDLKPSNIIVDAGGRLHLVDFGTAKVFSEEQTEDTVYIGTQGYAAPEQYGTGKSDERTDLYNLGMTLFHLASGVHPSLAPADGVEGLLRRNGVSKGFARFISDLVRTDPQARTGSALECLKRLEGLGGKRNSAADSGTEHGKQSMRLRIAITGIRHGVGTTLIGLSMAVYLADKGYRPVYADYRRSGDIVRLEDVLLRSGMLDASSEKCFSSGGVTYIREYSELENLPRRDLRIVVADMGCPVEGNALHEFNRADIRFVVCPGVDWKLELVKEYIENVGRLDANGEWIYLFPLTREADARHLKNTLRIKNVLIFPYIQNPFRQNRNEQKGIGEVLQKAIELSCTGCRLG